MSSAGDFDYFLDNDFGELPALMTKDLLVQDLEGEVCGNIALLFGI